VVLADFQESVAHLLQVYMSLAVLEYAFLNPDRQVRCALREGNLYACHKAVYGKSKGWYAPYCSLQLTA